MASTNETLIKRMMKVREEQDAKFIKKLEPHSRCGLLPAPELISVGSKPGSDTTKTLQDFNYVLEWLKSNNVLNTGFLRECRAGEDLHESNFKKMVTLAFNLAYVAIQETKSPELSEFVFWYYAGHGLSPVAAIPLPYSAIPHIDNLVTYQSGDCNEHLKGGELCLHCCGFCNLNGLLKPWIRAVKDKSNKHLVIVLDSCYSGIFADDLRNLKGQSENTNSWLKEGCSVTVQAASGADESTQGGYFTPTFLYLNQNDDVLQKLKEEWNTLDDPAKQGYRDLQVPSPMLETTRETSDNDPTIVVNEQNFKVTLFRDSGFFKYCYDSISLEHKDLGERVMTPELAVDFLEELAEYNVIDFKLKTMERGAFEDSPLGLFLFEKTGDDLAVCAHVHFAKNDTSKVGRINLVHHMKSLGSAVLQYEFEDTGGLRSNRHKISVAIIKKIASPKNPDDWFYWKWNATNIENEHEIDNISIYTDQEKITVTSQVKLAMKLVSKCESFVTSCRRNHDWFDCSKWNMTGSENNKFRATWMDEYLQKVERYGLPKIK